MRKRRHHNNKGYRQVRSGYLSKQAAYLERKYAEKGKTMQYSPNFKERTLNIKLSFDELKALARGDKAALEDIQKQVVTLEDKIAKMKKEKKRDVW